MNPVRLDHVTDKNFAYWHSATFNNDGTKIVFTDEWGGGGRPRCRATDLPTWGADAIFDIVDKKLRFGGYYKMPAAQTEQENCVAHNGSLIPVPGRDIMVQAWYQGGVSVFDFTDSANAQRDCVLRPRARLEDKELVSGGYWSTYWYNGNIYGAEIARGLDVFRLTPSEHLTQNEIDATTLVRFEEFNSQQRPRVTWPATFVVARAYLNQLTRSKAVQADSVTAIKVPSTVPTGGLRLTAISTRSIRSRRSSTGGWSGNRPRRHAHAIAGLDVKGAGRSARWEAGVSHELGRKQRPFVRHPTTPPLLSLLPSSTSLPPPPFKGT